MGPLFDTIEEAIAEADRMAAVLNKNRYIVVRGKKGGYRCLTRSNNYTEREMLYKTWGHGSRSAIFHDTPENKAMVASMTRKELAKKFNVAGYQIDYLLVKYGWQAKLQYVPINITLLRKAMQTMTIAEYSREIGVAAARLYQICKTHNIERKVLGRQPNRNYDSRSKVARSRTIKKVDEMRKYLKTHTIAEYAALTKSTLPWLYKMCEIHNIERPVRTKLGRPSR